MTTSSRNRFVYLFKWAALIFVLLFTFRFVYGYVVTEPLSGSYDADDFFSNLTNTRKNYASENNVMKADVQQRSAAAASQKYEKTATIKTKTAEFENDDKRIKDQANAFHAVIQYEQNLGHKGNRQVHLLIGVNPALFDSFYLQLQRVGSIKAMEITKVDKTNEYKQLNAKKASIEKALQSLNELKTRGGQIADFVTLNDKILETEEKLQELGVELGNFDAENEFCTVKVSMFEGAAEKTVSIYQRIKVALEWTIQYYALTLAILLLASLLIYAILKIADQMKIMNLINDKTKE